MSFPRFQFRETFDGVFSLRVTGGARQVAIGLSLITNTPDGVEYLCPLNILFYVRCII